MKYPVFTVEFLQEKIIERQEIAHSIRLEKLFHIRQWKIFQFLFLLLIASGPHSENKQTCELSTVHSKNRLWEPEFSSLGEPRFHLKHCMKLRVSSNKKLWTFRVFVRNLQKFTENTMSLSYVSRFLPQVNPNFCSVEDVYGPSK